jgi:hypothetical protein
MSSAAFFTGSELAVLTAMLVLLLRKRAAQTRRVAAVRADRRG